MIEEYMEHIKEYDLVIIGNGYDLHYDLPTNFSDFSDSFKNIDIYLNDYLNQYEDLNKEAVTKYFNTVHSIKESNFFLKYFRNYNEIFLDWNNFENHLKKIIKEFIDILNDIRIGNINENQITLPSQIEISIEDTLDLSTYLPSRNDYQYSLSESYEVKDNVLTPKLAGQYTLSVSLKGIGKIAETSLTINPHICNYNNKVIDESYLASKATCEAPATYYYSCECGAKGTSTFTTGNKTSHTSVYGGTSSVHTKCSVCNTTLNSSHSYTSTITSESTCTTQGTKTYSCKCGYSYTGKIAINKDAHSGKIVNGGTLAAHTKYNCCNKVVSAEHTFTSTTHTISTIDIIGQTTESCSCGYTYASIPKTIDSYTWNEIHILATAQLSSSQYKNVYGIEVGQAKDNTYYLVDLNNYTGFAFMYNSGIESVINESGDGRYSYASLKISSTVNNFYKTLPTEIQNVIKQVTIKCNRTPSTYTCKVFLPSAPELGSGTGDGTVFDYFATSGNLSEFCKLIPDNNWWTRTSHPTNAWSWKGVGSGAIQPTMGPEYSHLLVAVFVVGT